MKVSIVVCTVGSNNLTACLRSLQKQQYSEYEVLVMMEREVKQEVKGDSIQYHLAQNYNLSRTRNQGIRESKGDLIAFIDDDAVADPAWISNLVNCYRRKEKVGCIGGKIKLDLPANLPKAAKQLPEKMLRGFLSATTIEGGQQELDEPLIWGCNMAFPSSVFEQVGYFDPRLGRTPWNLKGEDEKDVQYRLLSRGYNLFWEPKAEVTHIISEKRLKSSYFLRRALWQGYSELIRISKQQDLAPGQKDLARNFALLRWLEEEGELETSSSLKSKIDSARKLGRISALLDSSDGNLRLGN